MTISINPEEPNQIKTPRSWSGGFRFDVAIPPVAVILVSAVVVWILSQITIVQTVPVISGERGHIAPLFSPGVQYWESKIITWSEAWDLDPDLVATVMQIESCGHPKARSSVGATGLFQVMPYHFSESEDPFKPNVNARRGLAYLKQAYEAGNGDIRLTFAGYNGGIRRAAQSESTWPGETIRYVYWGLGIYTDATKGKSHSIKLDEWLAAGGSSLCKLAAENLGIDD